MLFRLWLVLSTLWAVVVGYALSGSPQPLNGYEIAFIFLPFVGGIVIKKLFWFVLIGGQPKVVPAPREPRFKV